MHTCASFVFCLCLNGKCLQNDDFATGLLKIPRSALLQREYAKKGLKCQCFVTGAAPQSSAACSSLNFLDRYPVQTQYPQCKHIDCHLKAKPNTKVVTGLDPVQRKH